MPLTQNIHKRNRRVQQQSTPPSQAFATPTVTPVASTVVIDTDQPISLTGITPQVTVATRTFVSAVLMSPTQVVLTFSGTVATFDWMIQENDPAFRTASGGYIKAACGTFP